jgi:hypothetical protein
MDVHVKDEFEIRWSVGGQEQVRDHRWSIDDARKAVSQRIKEGGEILSISFYSVAEFREVESRGFEPYVRFGEIELGENDLILLTVDDLKKARVNGDAEIKLYAKEKYGVDLNQKNEQPD